MVIMPTKPPQPGDTGTAVIAGKTYSTIIMPDGKEWLSEWLQDDTAGGRWYKDNPANAWAGRHYNGPEYLTLSYPDGWRRNSKADVDGLFALVTSVEHMKLVAPDYWLSGSYVANNATNEFGLGVIPTGRLYEAWFFLNQRVSWIYGDPGDVLGVPGKIPVKTLYAGESVFKNDNFPSAATYVYGATRLVREPPTPPILQTPLEEAYTRQLFELLPKGPAWTRRPGTNIWKVLASCSAELSRLHGRAGDLLRELIPSTASESLPEWEEELGIPEPGTVLRITTEERRADVSRKFQALGGCSAAYFESQAELLGYSTTVNELYQGAKPFKAGAAVAGDALTQGRYLFTWEMVVHGAAGPDTFLETIIRRMAPKHTLVLFTYN